MVSDDCFICLYPYTPLKTNMLNPKLEFWYMCSFSKGPKIQFSGRFIDLWKMFHSFAQTKPVLLFQPPNRVTFLNKQTGPPACFSNFLLPRTGIWGHLEDHPRICKWLGSPLCINHETAICKGNNFS